MYFDPGDGNFLAVDGQIVERDALRIAERLQEHDPDLRVMCLDPSKADVNDAPFVICHQRSDGTMYRIFECWELDDRVVERVILADNHQYDAISKLESMQEIQRKLKEDRYRDKSLENQELVAAAVRNLKSSFSFKNDEGELVTVHDDKPVEKGHGRSYSYS